jgi:DNA-binding NarL/FixJ family response regulator
MRVFIVEDSEPIRRRLIATLSEMDGVEVVGWAQTEGEAIQRILCTLPEVAILDIQLREGNGMNVLEQVKRALKGLKVIVLTNFAYPQYRRRCAQAGADHFLDKSSEFMAVEGILTELAAAARYHV